MMKIKIKYELLILFGLWILGLIIIKIFFSISTQSEKSINIEDYKKSQYIDSDIVESNWFIVGMDINDCNYSKSSRSNETFEPDGNYYIHVTNCTCTGYWRDCISYLKKIDLT